MRDPNRIPRVTQKIQTVWLGTPDLRFWQLMAILKDRYAIDKFPERKTFEVKTDDLFYLEDEDFEKVLDNLISEMRG